MSLIRLSGIWKLYDREAARVEALRGIDLAVESGQFVSIMGPSGSGKSTMMNIIGCLDRATEGRYELDGAPTESLTDNELAEIRNRKIGFVFQMFYLLPRLTALGNVELPMIYCGLGRAERLRRAHEVLELVELGPRKDHLPNELSGGEKQRVAIARALVNDPSLLLADEPTGNLDSRVGAEILGLFVRLNRERRVTTLVVTHEPAVAAKAQRTVRLQDGKVFSDENSNQS